MVVMAALAPSAAPCHTAPSSAPIKPVGPPLKKLRAVVVGGGVAGLVAARALLDAGAEVSVYERRSQAEMLSGGCFLFVKTQWACSAQVLDAGDC